MAPLKILLVDDFEPWRAALRSMLEAMSSFQVIGEAGDGLEAIAKVKQLLPDVVLLDIGLPFLNGIEAASLSKLKDFFPDSRM